MWQGQKRRESNFPRVFDHRTLVTMDHLLGCSGDTIRAYEDSPGDAVDKNLPASAGDTSLIPGPGRSHIPQAAKPVPHSF